MQYITMAWSGKWSNIDLRFSGFNGYPDLSVLCGIHYAGVKPWRFKDKKTLSRFRKFQDYNLWYEKYIDMVKRKYVKLQKVPKLAKLLRHIEETNVDQKVV